MILKIFRKLCSFFESLLPLETQARRAGCKIGRNNFIASKFWCSEPYFISIGDSCQITNDVKILTHGGGKLQGWNIPSLIVLARLKSGTLYI